MQPLIGMTAAIAAAGFILGCSAASEGDAEEPLGEVSEALTAQEVFACLMPPRIEDLSYEGNNRVFIEFTPQDATCEAQLTFTTFSPGGTLIFGETTSPTIFGTGIGITIIIPSEVVLVSGFSVTACFKDGINGGGNCEAETFTF